MSRPICPSQYVPPNVSPIVKCAFLSPPVFISPSPPLCVSPSPSLHFSVPPLYYMFHDPLLCFSPSPPPFCVSNNRKVNKIYKLSNFLIHKLPRSMHDIRSVQCSEKGPIVLSVFYTSYKSYIFVKSAIFNYVNK